MKINKISARNFKPYGWVIEYPNKSSKNKKINLFRIVIEERHSAGWRIAYLVVRDKSIRRVEQHPNSFESFEPVSGRSLLYVAASKNPQKVKCFYLDKPVVLKKGIWHGVAAIDKEAEIKITENLKVKCVYLPYEQTSSRILYG